MEPLIARRGLCDQCSELRRNKIGQRGFSRAREILDLFRNHGFTDCTSFGTVIAAIEETERHVCHLTGMMQLTGMYAIKLANKIYHLLQREAAHTICGLRINRVRARGGARKTVDEVGQETICKNCKRINDQEPEK
jgi:hypothetical protein